MFAVAQAAANPPPTHKHLASCRDNFFLLFRHAVPANPNEIKLFRATIVLRPTASSFPFDLSPSTERECGIRCANIESGVAGSWVIVGAYYPQRISKVRYHVIREPCSVAISSPLSKAVAPALAHEIK